MNRFVHSLDISSILSIVDIYYSDRHAPIIPAYWFGVDLQHVQSI